MMTTTNGSSRWYVLARPRGKLACPLTAEVSILLLGRESSMIIPVQQLSTHN